MLQLWALRTNLLKWTGPSHGSVPWKFVEKLFFNQGLISALILLERQTSTIFSRKDVIFSCKHFFKNQRATPSAADPWRVRSVWNWVHQRTLVQVCNPFSSLAFLCFHHQQAISNVSNRRKFRSETSDKRARWKSRGGQSQRRAEKKQEDQRRERVRRKKMQVRAKVEKSQTTVCFQCFVTQEGRKVGSLKWRVRSHLARWEMKNCTACGAKQISKSKCRKHRGSGALLDVEMSRKCTPLWREAHFQVKMIQNARRSTPGSEHFWKLRCRKSERCCGARNWVHIVAFATPKHHATEVYCRTDLCQ